MSDLDISFNLLDGVPDDMGIVVSRLSKARGELGALPPMTEEEIDEVNSTIECVQAAVADAMEAIELTPMEIFARDRPDEYAMYLSVMAEMQTDGEEEPDAAFREFRIIDEESAEWVLRLMANAEAEVNRIDENYAKKRRRAANQVRALEYRFESELARWGAQYLEVANRGKKNPVRSITTFQGTLKYHNTPPSFRIGDRDAALAHAKSAGLSDCWKSVETVVGGEYNRYARIRYDDAGEIVPGIIRTPAHESFNIDFGNIKGQR